jgi:subtilisin family serine protease
MNKKLILLHLLVVASLISPGGADLYSQDKYNLQQQDILQIPKQYEQKLLSGKLQENISQKLYATKLGKVEPAATKALVTIYFKSYPSDLEIQDLQNLGLVCYLNSWIPPLPNHPYGFILAELPPSELINMLRYDFVQKVGTAEEEAYPQNNEAARKIKADSVWFKGYTGTGIKVGILDSGLDTAPANSDLPATLEKKDYSNYPTLDDNVENTVTGHGTHVTGSVLGRGVLSVGNTGNGGGAYKGMAPDAGLVFLKIGNDATGSASSAAMIAAMQDAVSIYHANILSMSYGGWYEHHDGSSADEQTVDWVYSQGVPFFISAGNSAASGRHYSGTVAGSGTTGYIQVNVTSATTNSTRLYFNLVWSDGSERKNLNLRYYNSSYVEITSGITRYTTTESTRGTESQYSTYTTYVPSGNSTYYLKVDNPSSTSQFFHIYEDWGDGKVTFASPDQNYTIGQPASADYACAVAAYVSRSSWTDYGGSGWTSSYTLNAIAPFSSRGPRIDGLQKPNIAAPGSVIISIRDRDVYTVANTSWVDNDGIWSVGGKDYYVMQGTSMSCPVAAGAAALLLSKKPSATPGQIYSAITTNAIIDSYTGAVPNSTWGYGKLNANAAIEDAALPIQLASFSGSYVGNSAKLEWQTISETNNYGFNVQRLNELTSNFQTIVFVEGNGTTLTPQSYSYIDDQPGNSYRLEQIDNDGLKSYFGPIMLNPNSVADNVPTVFKLSQNYPNPFNPTTKISFSLANTGHTSLTVYNILGSEVVTLFNGNAEAGKQYVVNFDAKNLTSGIYFYKLQSGNSVEVKKLTLVK